MKTPKSIELVAEFHETFKHPIENSGIMPSDERCKLRIALISEELKELESSILDKNIIEIADALCDLQYVLAGAILEFGLGNKFNDLFNEVHRSNMSKAAGSKADAEATVQFFKTSQNTDAYFEEVAGRYLVYRKSDNKILKSINYSPADLKTILNR